MVDVVPFETLPSTGGGIEDSILLVYCFQDKRLKMKLKSDDH